jgi:hypothetical protein
MFVKLALWCSCCGSLLAAAPALACFTVSDDDDRVVYHSADPPVDMSRPLHETVPLAFPGGHMVFDLETRCVALPNADASSLRPVAVRERAAVVRVVSAPETAAAIAPELASAALLADLGPRARYDGGK